ncbi:hypothetical protein ABIA72_002232 [Stenotrophomonas rhizophila]
MLLSAMARIKARVGASEFNSMLHQRPAAPSAPSSTRAADFQAAWGAALGCPAAERALELVLPWPSKDLSPNSRVNWRRRAEATKFAREMAVVLAFEAGWRDVRLPAGRLHLWLDFY